MPLTARFIIDQAKSAKVAKAEQCCIKASLRCSKTKKKRTAAELLTRCTPLEGEFSQRSASKEASPDPPVPVQASACDDIQDSQCLRAVEQDWFQFPISVQQTDWETGIAKAREQIQAHSQETPNFGGTTDIILVQQAKDIENAVKRLRDSMQDPVIGVDLEWKPEFTKGQALSPVALIQLASNSLAVLIRCEKFNSLPPALINLFGDPSVVFVGYGWDASDEQHFMLSFGRGKSSFANFLDLQDVSARHGYIGYSLAGLVQRIMHVDIRKTRTVSLSNWAATPLKESQIVYAALDAFMTGEAFRGLRILHSAPSMCPNCKTAIGELMPPLQFQCLSCTRDFKSFHDLQRHCKSMSHDNSLRKCEECGRTSPDWL